MGKKGTVVVDQRTGVVKTLLTPHGKREKYFVESINVNRMTNDLDLKVDKKGNPLPLNDTQLAWRSGYLQAGRDSAACYNHNKAKKAKKAKRSRK